MEFSPTVAAAGEPFLKTQLVVQVKLLSPWVQPPLMQTEGSVGYDLCLSYQSTIRPRSTRTFDLQIALAIPPGLYGQLASRSLLAAEGITVRCSRFGYQDRGEQGRLRRKNQNSERHGKNQKGHGGLSRRDN